MRTIASPSLALCVLPPTAARLYHPALPEPFVVFLSPSLPPSPSLSPSRLCMAAASAPPAACWIPLRSRGTAASQPCIAASCRPPPRRVLNSRHPPVSPDDERIQRCVQSGSVRARAQCDLGGADGRGPPPGRGLQGGKRRLYAVRPWSHRWWHRKREKAREREREPAEQDRQTDGEKAGREVEHGGAAATGPERRRRGGETRKLPSPSHHLAASMCVPKRHPDPLPTPFSLLTRCRFKYEGQPDKCLEKGKEVTTCGIKLYVEAFRRGPTFFSLERVGPLPPPLSHLRSAQRCPSAFAASGSYRRTAAKSLRSSGSAWSRTTRRLASAARRSPRWTSASSTSWCVAWPAEPPTVARVAIRFFRCSVLTRGRRRGSSPSPGPQGIIQDVRHYNVQQLVQQKVESAAHNGLSCTVQ